MSEKKFVITGGLAIFTLATLLMYLMLSHNLTQKKRLVNFESESPKIVSPKIEIETRK